MGIGEHGEKRRKAVRGGGDRGVSCGVHTLGHEDSVRSVRVRLRRVDLQSS